MECLNIHQAGEYSKKIAKMSTEVLLLAEGDGVQVMMQTIASQKRFSLSSDGKWSGFEFLYILDGILSFYDSSGKKISLKRGDYISAQKMKESAHFRTEMKTQLLYISSKPSFGLISKEIHELMAIAMAVEKKDFYTKKHCEMVQNICMRLGEALSLSPDRIELLIYAGYLHDIGKVCVPDEILGKPGKLTPQEMEVMKKHPTVSREMIEKTFMKEVGPIVEQHHERIDGSGYPKGLKNDEVSVEGQIVGIVDAYHAMSSNRSYRSALTKEKVVEELKYMAGTKFDRQIVNTFLNILKAQKP